MGFFNRIIAILLLPVRAIAFLFSRLVPGFRRVTTLSLPARLAMLSFVALLITGIAVLLHFFLMSDRYKDWPDWLDDWRLILVVIACIVLVPACIYLAVELLMRGEQSRFPDLDSAWAAGIKALQDHGIDLARTPLFLVIGEGETTMAAHFHAAARLQLPVSGATSGVKPLQWFAGEEAIFLHLPGASSLSRMARLLRTPGSGGAAPGGAAADGPKYLRTITGGEAPAPRHTETLAPGSPAAGSPPDSPRAAAPAAASARNMQTLVPGAAAEAGQAPPPSRVDISQYELDECAERLAYVCGLLRRHRAPVCPLNGVVARLPLEGIAGSHDQLRTAFNRDAETTGNACRMRFPLTVLVAGIENDPGFKELMRRFTTEEIERGRIGSRYGTGDSDVWTPVNAARLTHLASSACRNIIDNIRQFYGRSDALQRPGNGKLFLLLSRIRGEFGNRLQKLIAGGLGQSAAMPSGCYFVAAGDGPDSQGFLASVVREKVMGNRGKLSWLPAALREHNRYQLASSVCALLTLVSLAAFAFMLIRDIFFSG